LTSSQYEELAAGAVRKALDSGASDAECTIVEGQEFSASVRMGEVENLKDAGSRGMGIRVVRGRRSGSAYTSDLSREGVERMIRAAIENATVTSEDPNLVLPEPSALGKLEGDLQIYCEQVSQLDTPCKIEQARLAEAAALQLDPRITNSEGGSFDSYLSERVFANSRGFCGSYQASNVSLSVVPVASEGGAMERDYWFTVSRRVDGLERPEHVGRMAAQRALRRLGSRKVPTTKVPIVFDQRTARALLNSIFDAVNGEAVYRKSSFLTGKLGEQVASSKLTVIDDSTLPGLFGTTPFDDEGVPSQRTVIIGGGVLQNYLLNTYTARKLGLKSTGSASRGLSGNPGIGHGNLFVEPGTSSPEEMIASVRDGFYITDLLGFGVNIVTGDYSRGAAGLWIRDGELAFPVSEVTIAGNLKQMLMDLEAVGSDLDFRGSIASPTLLIREMTVAGN
jgi:PmbA protein